MMKLATTALVVACVNLATWGAVHAEEKATAYPQHIVKIIVPFPAGGTADALPRIVAEKLRERLGQPFIIENRSGAGGNVGAEMVAKSDPDGYTLLASPPGPIVINEALFPNLPFRPSDLKPITILGTAPNVLAVKSTLSSKTVGDLIALAKSKPEGLTFASQGNGSTSHLTAVLFQFLTGTKMLHIPYRGTAPALQDLAAGNVDLFFDNLGSSLNLHNSGQIRILAVGGAKRVKSLPDIPSVEESGVPGFRSTTWFALMASPNTPAPIVGRLNEAVAGILKEPDVIAQFERIGVQPVGESVEASSRFIADERVRWRDVVRSANVALQ